MRNPKRLICCILVMLMIPALTSCSIDELVEDIKGIFKSDSSTSSKDKDPPTDQIVIQALQNHDAQAIKDLFSAHAKELIPDLDEGIEYLFSLFEGDYIKCTHHNNGGSSHYAKGESWTLSDPVCMFQTTEHFYKLTWNEFSVFEADPDMVGVYRMELEVWENEGLDTGGKSSNLVGIVHPGNKAIFDAAWDLYYNIYHSNTPGYDEYIDKFREVLSDNALAAGVSDEDIASLCYEGDPVVASNRCDGWIKYEDDGRVIVYLKGNQNKVPKCLYFGMDKDQPDKIAFVKLVSDDPDKRAGTYDYLWEAPGVYPLK